MMLFQLQTVLSAVALSTVVLTQGTAASSICARNATLGTAVVNAMNLSWPGLEQAAEHAASGDLGAACTAIAAYYRTGNTSAWLRLGPAPAPSSRMAGGAADDLVLRDIFTLNGVKQVAKIPRNEDGGIQWYFKGPQKDPEVLLFRRMLRLVLLLTTFSPLYLIPAVHELLEPAQLLHGAAERLARNRQQGVHAILQRADDRLGHASAMPRRCVAILVECDRRKRLLCRRGGAQRLGTYSAGGPSRVAVAGAGMRDSNQWELAASFLRLPEQ